MSLEDLSMEARDELALLARQLAENPATRKDFLRLTRKQNPGMVMPELEIEDSTNSALEKAEKRVQAMEAREQQRNALDELKARRMNLIKKGLVNDESEIDEVEKVMLDKGITKHEAAAEYWQWMKQSAAPTPMGYSPSAMNKFDLSKYWKNPVMGARDEAAKALNELRKNPRPIGL
jgi:antitoxin component HigA of HigAB toxin-antitoxin module